MSVIQVPPDHPLAIGMEQNAIVSGLAKLNIGQDATCDDWPALIELWERAKALENFLRGSK